MMDRRRFLTVSTAGVVASTLGGAGAARAADSPTAPPMKDAPWRTFEIVTDVEIRPKDAPAKLWLPLPLYRDTDYQQTLDIRWSGNPATSGIHRDPKFGAPAFHATWKDGSDAPKLQLVTVVTARNRSVDLSKPGSVQRVAREELELYLQPTTHIPTDGIVRATASRLLPFWGNTLDRARAIYEWIVENTYRDPRVVGCGTGDIRFMLESGDLGGKCADLNSLFVGLSRCAGIPARNVYGVRVADSATWKSLGKSGDITRAQHCRAEFYHPTFGWVPVDPADVRKVILDEEKDQLLPLSDPRVVLARKTLFGAWEMNWMAYNTANDTRLAPQANKALGHFMYPYAEGAKGVLDYYTPQGFKYQMTAREVKS